MARHSSRTASNKHKESPKGKHKHRKHSSGSTSTLSKPKRVSFGGTSSDIGTNKSSHRESKSRDKFEDYDSHQHPNSTATKQSTSLKEQSSTKNHSIGNGHSHGHSIRPYSSTSGMLKSSERHHHHSSHHIKLSKSNPNPLTPIQQKRRKDKKRHKKRNEVHPLAARFSDSIQRQTNHLLTALPEQLQSIAACILESLPSINIFEPSGKSYQSYVAEKEAYIMAKYGSLIPMDVVREFQANCRSWAKELKMYYQEYAAVQQELADLAKEIGISHGAAGVNKQGEDNGPTDSDAEFDEMVKEMKQAGKTWVTKMDKLEKQIFQEESRQNMLMMQAM